MKVGTVWSSLLLRILPDQQNLLHSHEFTQIRRGKNIEWLWNRLIQNLVVFNYRPVL